MTGEKATGDKVMSLYLTVRDGKKRKMSSVYTGFPNQGCEIAFRRWGGAR